MAGQSSQRKSDLLPDQSLVMSHIADLIMKVTPLKVTHPSPLSFIAVPAKKTAAPGIQSVVAEYDEAAAVRVRFELLRCPQDVRIPAAIFFEHLAGLGPRTQIAQGDKVGPHTGSLWVAFSVEASSISLTRSNALVQEIKRIDDLAKALQAELPSATTSEDEAALYKDVADIMAPIPSWTGQEEPHAVSSFFAETAELLQAATLVALVADHTIELEWALAGVSGRLLARNDSLGQILVPAISTRGVIELAKRAPGVPVIPLAALRLGMQPTDIQSEWPALSSLLLTRRKTVLFSGLASQFHDVLDLSQGRHDDSLLSTCHLPEMPFEELTRFAIYSAAKKAGGLTIQEQDTVSLHLLDCIDLINPSHRSTYLPYLAQSEIQAWLRGTKPELDRTCRLICKLQKIHQSK